VSTGESGAWSRLTAGFWAVRIVGRNLGCCQREAGRVRLVEGECVDGQAVGAGFGGGVGAGPSLEFVSVWPG
jgi:hypothetical protein